MPRYLIERRFAEKVELDKNGAASITRTLADTGSSMKDK